MNGYEKRKSALFEEEGTERPMALPEWEEERPEVVSGSVTYASLLGEGSPRGCVDSLPSVVCS